MNEIAATSLPLPKRFFPLHLKLLLSYLAFAGAILAISSAFAWREANVTRSREGLALFESSFQQVNQAVDRRVERAMAVVNLVSASPELTKQFAAGGTINLPPGTAFQQSAIGNEVYNTNVLFVSDLGGFLAAQALDSPKTESATGIVPFDGRPQAIAVSPLFSGQGVAGYLLVSVDLVSATESLRSDDHKAKWIVASGDGSWKAMALGGIANESLSLSRGDFMRLSNGEKLERQTGANKRTVYYPLPGIAQKAVAAIAIEGPAAAGSSSANPLLGLAVLTLSFGLLVAHFLARVVSHPVEQITEATERVASGDLSYKLPEQRGRDELSILQNSFNQMTEKYRTSQAEVEAASQRLKDTVHEQEKEIETLFGISRAITSILDVNGLLEQVLRLSMPLVGAHLGVVWLTPPESGEAQAPSRKLLPHLIVSGEEEIQPIYIGENHEIFRDVRERNWKISVMLPGPDAGGNRQLFFAAAEESATYRLINETAEAGIRLPAGPAGPEHTQVTVPVHGQKGFAEGILMLAIDGHRPLTEHEALLISNIVGLASVAVENAELYGVAHKRGEQIALLLRESHHRITNNLAAISGVLSIQLAKTKDPELSRVIEDNISRISSIAHVHRLLSGDMKDSVDINAVIKSVAAPTVAATGSSQINVKVGGTAAKLPAKQATSVALIINEMVINSLKHGFAGRNTGNIDITSTINDSQLCIEYRDDGAGFKPGKEPLHQGLGTQIVNSLIREDLEGEWSQESQAGYVAHICFPLQNNGRKA